VEAWDSPIYAVSETKHFLISGGLARVFFGQESTPQSVSGRGIVLISGGLGDMKFAHERA